MTPRKSPQGRVKCLIPESIFKIARFPILSRRNRGVVADKIATVLSAAFGRGCCEGRGLASSAPLLSHYTSHSHRMKGGEHEDIA